MFSYPSVIQSAFSTGEIIKLKNPNDQTDLVSVQYAQKSDLPALKNEILKRQKKVSTLKAYERAEILLRFKSYLRDHQEDFAKLIAHEGGKPLRDARIEVERAQTTIELCAEEAKRIAGEMIPMEKNRFGDGHLSFTVREPIGAVFALCAFNHPLNLICHQVGASFAAGNTTLFKPAPSIPLTAWIVEEFFKSIQAEFAFLTVHLHIPEIEDLLQWSEFKFVQFIGSPEVGWTLPRKLSPGTRLSLELGGKAAAIVCETADLSRAVNALLKSSFTHSGQVCISTQKIYVHESRLKEFSIAFTEGAKKLKALDARSETSDLGPMIRESEAKRVFDWFHEALKEGASSLLTPVLQGSFLSPGILLQPSKKSKVMTHEVFGPLVSLLSFNQTDEVIHELNLEEAPFEHCIFTQNLQEAFTLAREIKAQTLVINDHNAYRVDWMPFGGHEKAGLGMGGVKYAIEEMTKLKQIMIRS